MSEQLGYGWPSLKLSHRAALRCEMFSAASLRSSGALPTVTHWCIWTRGEEVKGRRAVWICGDMHSSLRHAVQWWIRAGRVFHLPFTHGSYQRAASTGQLDPLQVTAWTALGRSSAFRQDLGQQAWGCRKMKSSLGEVGCFTEQWVVLKTRAWRWEFDSLLEV